MSVTLTPQNAAQYGFTPPSGPATAQVNYYTQSGQPTSAANAYFTAPSGGYSFTGTPRSAPIDAPNTTTLPEGALQPTTTEQAGSRKVISVIDTILNTPSLPTGTQVAPELQTVQPTETMATAGLTGQVVAATPTAGTVPTITPTTVPGSTAAGQQTTATPASMAAAQVAGQTPTMTAEQMSGLTAPAVAATGTVDADATVRGQLAKINQDIETSLATGSALPAYLRGVAKATQAAMA